MSAGYKYPTGRRWERQQALSRFVDQHNLYAYYWGAFVPLKDAFVHKLLKLVRKPGPGRRWHVVAGGEVPLDQVIAALKFQQSQTEHDPVSWVLMAQGDASTPWVMTRATAHDAVEQP